MKKFLPLLFLVVLSVLGCAPRTALQAFPSSAPSLQSPVPLPLSPFLRLDTGMHTARMGRITGDARGRYLLTASEDKSARLWDAATGQLLRTFRPFIGEGSEGMLYACALSPDGRLAALGGWTGYSIYIFDTETGKLVHSITGLENASLDLAFSPDGRYLAAALGLNNGVRIFSVSAGFGLHKRLGEYGGHTHKLAFDPEGRLATVSYDGYLRLYDAGFNLMARVQPMGGQQPYHLAFSPDGLRIAVTFNDSPHLEVYDGKTLGFLYRPDIRGAETPGNQMLTPAFSGNGLYLFAGGTYRLYRGNYAVRQIRRWKDGGQGAFEDFPAASNTVLSLFPMGDADLAYSGFFPDMGRMKADGTLAFYHEAALPSYAARDASHLRLSFAGDHLAATPLGGTPFYFSLSRRTLGETAPGEALFSCTREREGLRVTDWAGKMSATFNGRVRSFLKPHERIYSMDIQQDGKRVLLGADWHLYARTPEGEALWQTPVPAPVWALTLARDQKSLVAALGDGTLRWYRTDDGSLLMSLFVHKDRKRWLLWTPDGYFDSSGPDAESLVGWHLNQGPDREALFYPLSRFYDRYNLPGLGIQVLAQQDFRDKGEPEAGAERFLPPPRVHLSSSEDRQGAGPGTLTLTLVAEDQGGGIDEIRLYHNDKLVEGTGRGFIRQSPLSGKEVRTFTLSLLPGQNRFRATAYNARRTESAPQELVLFYAAPLALRPSLYILSVGIDTYRNPRYRLAYAVKDAETFARTLEGVASPLFGKTEILSVRNGDATREGLLQALQTLQEKVTPQDVLVFHYAGHGVMGSREEGQRPDFYMVLHDVIKMYQADSHLKEKGLAASELVEILRKISARKQILLLDSCQSGAAIDSFFTLRGAAEEKAMDQLSRSTGTHVLAASSPDQEASEVETLGHGIFTYSLLESLRGACHPMEGRITVQHLKGCVELLVPDLTEKHRGQPQYPMGFGYGQDFPLGLVR